MDTIEDIQRSIEKLSVAEIARLREWLDELDGRLLDEKVARDAKAGKLDKVLAEVEANMKAGRGQDF